jgi:hypothetical protein
MHSFADPLAILAILGLALSLGAIYVLAVCVRNLVRWIREEFRK